MEFNKKFRVKRYLERFEEILCTMEHKMLCEKPNDSITKYFIKCMVPHHQAAIYMSENLLMYTGYEPLMKIAQNIIIMQTKGISIMNEIYSTTTCVNSPEDIQDYTKKYLEITNTMISKMRNAPKTMNINFNFINEMIPHHEGAVEMCKNVLRFNIDERLKQEAEDIIKEQENGILELKALLANF